MIKKLLLVGVTAAASATVAYYIGITHGYDEGWDNALKETPSDSPIPSAPAVKLHNH
jgi:hypothetical protein